MSLLDMDFDQVGSISNKPTVTLSAQDSQSYSQLWSKAVSGGPGPLKGAEAAAFLGESGLPRDLLAQIWQLVDVEKKGTLDKQGFQVLLKLVALKQNNIEPVIANLGRVTPLPNLGSKSRTSSPSIGNITWDVSAQDKSKFDSQFRTLNPVNGVVDGATAGAFFKKSGLPVVQLKSVWEMADLDKSGKLTADEFAVAMHLIIGIKRGSPLPEKLPETLIPPSVRYRGTLSVIPDQATQRQLSNQSTGGGNEGWSVNPIEKAQYYETFKTIMTNEDGAQMALGPKCRDIFSKSNLDKGDLGQIWRLVDFEKKGKLDEYQFALAMHLIHQKRKGEVIPAQLTQSDIPPAWRDRYTPSGVSATAPSMPAPRQMNSIFTNVNDGMPPVIPRRSLPPGFVPPLPVDQMTTELIELGNKKKELQLELETARSQIEGANKDIKPLEDNFNQLQQQYAQVNKGKQQTQMKLQDMTRKGEEYQRTLAEMDKRHQQEDMAIKELRVQIGNQAGNIEQLKGEYTRITGGVSGLQERHKNLTGEVEANIKEMRTMSTMMQEINSQITDLKKQLVEEELEVERGVKKLQSTTGGTATLPFGMGSSNYSAFNTSNAPTYVPQSKQAKPPKPLNSMTEKEQIEWAMQTSEKELTPADREEKELRQALEASLAEDI
eukprot:CFRG2929T1